MGDRDKLSSGYALDIGRNPKRRTNQDHLAVFEPFSRECPENIYIVCDGMGGHHLGELASRIVVSVIPKAYCEARKQKSIVEALKLAFRKAHAAIIQYASERGDQRTMGTTAVVAVVVGNRLYGANVGDSRAYLIRDEKIVQLSTDHTRVAVMVRAGKMTEAQAKVSKKRGVLTRSISNARKRVEPDIFRYRFQSGDVLVLCSDGLWGVVPDTNIAKTARRLSPQKTAEALVKTANRAGGPDNISVIVVRRGVLEKKEEEDTGEIALVAR